MGQYVMRCVVMVYGVRTYNVRVYQHDGGV